MKVISNHEYIPSRKDLKAKKRKPTIHRKKVEFVDVDAITMSIDDFTYEKQSSYNFVPLLMVLTLFAATGWGAAGLLTYNNFSNSQPESPKIIAGAVEQASAFLTIPEQQTPTTSEVSEIYTEDKASEEVIENKRAEAVNTEDVVVPEGEVSVNEYLDNATNLQESESMQEYYYKQIPDKYRELFEASGYTWVVYDGDIASLANDPTNTLEYIDIENQTIYVNNKDDAAVIHAVGTFIFDNYIEKDKKTYKEFKKLFENEFYKVQDKFAETYNVSYDTTRSYAAAGFYLYVMKPNKLYTTSSSTYTYFKNMEFIKAPQ